MTIFKRCGPYFLIAAALGDASLPYLLGRFYPGYRQMTMLISQLGETESPVANWFNHGSLITGTLFILGGVATWRAFSHLPRLGRWLGGAIAFYGLGDCILSSLVSISPQASFFSPAYFFHAACSGLAMVAMMTVPLLLAGLAYLKNQLGWTYLYLSLFIGSLVTLILFASYYLPGIGTWFATTRGLWQRLSLLCLYLPAILLAVTLLRFPKGLTSEA